MTSKEDLRKLDARIAEKVMGYEEVEQIGERLQYHNVEMDSASETGGRWNSTVPLFSSDFYGAMLVIDKIRDAFGGTIHLELNPHREWFVYIILKGVPEGLSRSENLPEAICYCALSVFERYSTGS